MSDKMVKKLCTFTPEQMARIEKYAVDRRLREPGARFDLTDAIRMLVERGLERGKKAGVSSGEIP